jgi:hypothetical protein
MTDEVLATMATKLAGSVRDDFVELAKRRNVTPSALLRALVERELAGGADGEQAGEVETAVLAEIGDRGVDVESARAQVAVNLARRMDRVPTSGAPNAAQLRLLLAELVPYGASSIDVVLWLRMCAQFRRRGWRIIDESGTAFDMISVDHLERDLIVSTVAG